MSKIHLLINIFILTSLILLIDIKSFITDAKIVTHHLLYNLKFIFKIFVLKFNLMVENSPYCK